MYGSVVRRSGGGAGPSGDAGLPIQNRRSQT